MTVMTVMTVVLGYPLLPVIAVTVTPAFFHPKPQGAGWAGRKPCFKGVQRERLAHDFAGQSVVCYTL
ncbi:hypothetical protein V1226_14455 [Lachnospiraceae bacterium JLR.KK009]